MSTNQPEVIHVIEAGKTEITYWKDLWKFRELFYFLSWRDILVRYKQTAIGVAWSLLRPLMTMIVFTIVFGKIAKLPSDGAPYPIMVFAAMLPWQFFSNAISECSNSLIGNSNLISKVYFPRLIIPTSTVIVCAVDFAISFVLMLGLMAWYGFVPSVNIFALPLLFFLVTVTAIGPGLWLCALNVEYRDFRFIVPFMVQLGLFVSPVGFSSSIIPEKWRLIYSINPMVGVIEGFRWAIIGNESKLNTDVISISVVISLALLFSGIWYFRKTEKTFADLI